MCEEDKIRELAYYKWLDAGCPENTGARFWDEAKAELYGGYSDSDDGDSDDGGSDDGGSDD
mgnify:FL=1